jgi:hypothetical protein
MRRTVIGVVLASLLAVPQAARTQELSAAEKALAKSVEARLGEEMVALERVVNIDSGTFNVEGVREVGRYRPSDSRLAGSRCPSSCTAPGISSPSASPRNRPESESS